MSDDEPADLAALTAFLGEEPPSSAGALEQEAVDDLVQLCRQAQADQVRQISRAIDEALRLVPRPLRGMVKRVIGA